MSLPIRPWLLTIRFTRQCRRWSLPLLFLLTVSDSAAAQQQSSPPPSRSAPAAQSSNQVAPRRQEPAATTGTLKNFLRQLTRRQIAERSLAGLLLIAVGFLIGKLWDFRLRERGAVADARRQFWSRVSEQISDLARQNYWSLANYSGVVAGLLQEYLDVRTYHLLLQWENHADLEKRLNELAEEEAETSFCYFCRMLTLFNDFQFEKSNTYLLTNEWSGEIARKLYNLFIEGIDWEDDGKRIDTFKIIDVMHRKTSAGVLVRELTVEEFNREIARKPLEQGGLKQVLEAYIQWRAKCPDKVRIVAESLRAYSELLQHELSILYEEWLKRRVGGPKALAKSLAQNQWPGIISEGAFQTIDRARLQSSSLRPIGKLRPPPMGSEVPREAQQRGPRKAHAQSSKSDHGRDHAPRRSSKRVKHGKTTKSIGGQL